MQILTAASVALATLAGLASAAPSSASNYQGKICLTQTTADSLTNGYASLLTGPQSPTFNSTVNAILSSNFTDTSDSINWLAGIPLGSTTFASKAAFVGGQGTQAPIGFTVTENIFSCDEVAFRWTATVGLKKWPVKGINYYSTSNLNNTQAGYQILNMYSEFNVGAWEVDIGRTCSATGANV